MNRSFETRPESVCVKLNEGFIQKSRKNTNNNENKHNYIQTDYQLESTRYHPYRFLRLYYAVRRITGDNYTKQIFKAFYTTGLMENLENNGNLTIKICYPSKKKNSKLLSYKILVNDENFILNVDLYNALSTRLAKDP